MEEGKYNRDINILKSRDKSQKLQTLQRLLVTLKSEQFLLQFFPLFKVPLLDLIQDPSDKCKELTIKILIFFIETTSVPPEDISHLIQSIYNRIGVESSPETCEEIRVNLIGTIFLICKHYRDFFHLELQKITDIVAKGCRDKCPAVKFVAAEITVFLSNHCQKVGFYTKKIVEHCIGNIFHQQFKIRLSALEIINAIVQCEGGFEIVNDLYNDFKKVQLDRRKEVVDYLYEVVFNFLVKIPPEFLGNVEGKFCYLLLSSEKDARIWLDEIGKIRKLQEKKECEYEHSLYIVMKNLKEIVNLCLKDLQEWTLQDNYRSKARSALSQLLLICKHLILTHIDTILPVLFKTFSYENVDFFQNIIQEIGKCCDFSFLIYQFSQFCTLVNSSQDVASALSLLNYMILPMSPFSIILSPLLELISNIIETDDVLILRGIHCLILELLKKFEASLPIESIFIYILVLDSSPISTEIEPTISLLAQYGGISVRDLYQQNLNLLLPSLIKNYKYWDSSSNEIKKFVKLACRSQTCNETVLEVICYTCKKETDDLLKIYMLEVAENCIKDSGYSQIVLDDIFLPTAAWKLSSNALRIKSVRFLYKLIENEDIDVMAIKYMWEKFFPVIRTCINDENSELRAVNVGLLGLLLQKSKNILEERELLDIYPEFIKRLDDSVDSIRIFVTDPFAYYFEVIKEKNIKFGNFRYVVNNLFTHLDDPSEHIQKAVSKVLEQTAKFRKDEFLAIAIETKGMHKHPRAVGNLIEFARNLTS